MRKPFTKAAQKVLLAQTLRLRLLKKLARMELTRDEWKAVSQFKLRNSAWDIFKDFYFVQDEREKIMHEKKLAYPKFIDYAVPGNTACGTCPPGVPEGLQQYCGSMELSQQG